jgi:hypothetical protein
MYLKYFAHSIEHLKFLLVPDTLKAQSVLVSTILITSCTPLLGYIQLLLRTLLWVDHGWI